LACTSRGAASPLLTAYCPLIVYLSSTFQRAAEDGFAADFGSVSGDGRGFRYCTVGELLRDCDLVSVRAVQEKCDEKGLGAASGHRDVRCRQFGRALFGYPPRLRSGLRQNRAGFLEKREKGRTPGWLVPTIKGKRVRLSTLMWPTRLIHLRGVRCDRFSAWE
jgi:hypothetical protein